MRRVVALALSLVLNLAAPTEAGACVGLAPPVPGPIVSPYAPSGSYAGHWGIDLLADPGRQVRAAGAGVVTFAGVVAGNRTVTVDHGGGLRSSYSYLATALVGQGNRVRSGQTIGLSGAAHDLAGVHFSVRIEGRYVDPEPWFECRPLDVSRGLRLVR